VRCGPLGHTAIVYKIDRAKQLVYFTDPLYEFWLPSHNACIRRFDLVPSEDGRFLAAVPTEEVMSVLQALVTFRDPQSPAVAPQLRH
jgi:hypothetical protein